MYINMYATFGGVIAPVKLSTARDLTNSMLKNGYKVQQYDNYSWDVLEIDNSFFKTTIPYFKFRRD